MQDGTSMGGINALLDELKNASVLLQTHWEETRSLWDDVVRDEVEKTFIETFRNTIQLCLDGQYGGTYVYGRGMFDFFEFIEKAAATLSKYSGEDTKFNSLGEHPLTIRYGEDDLHKKRYSDEEEGRRMVDYDNYPK